MNRMELFCKFQLYSDLGTIFVSPGVHLSKTKKNKKLKLKPLLQFVFFLAQNLINAMGERPKASAR